MARYFLKASALIVLAALPLAALQPAMGLTDEAANLDAGYLPLSFVQAEASIATRERRQSPRPDNVAAALAALLESQSAGDGKVPPAVATFYKQSGYRPLWVEHGRLTPGARAVVERLARADEDGLDPSHYATPNPRLGIPRSAPAVRLAEAELQLTLSALAYARHAQGGRVNPSSLGRNVTAKPTRPDSARVLQGLAQSDNAADFLDSFNPQHPAFAALRDKLAALRAADRAPRFARIAEGTLIRPGKSDARIPELRARLEQEEVSGAETEFYDPALVAAVEGFQERSGLEVDGIIGPATLRALNSARDVTVADILVNMERWRWLPHDMGGDHYVWVNVPEFRLRIVTGGESVFDTRVIVGRQDRQTPIFSDEIEYLEVNPYWHVPTSIAAKDLLPELRKDPLSLYRRGIQIYYTGGGQSREIDPRLVNWDEWGGGSMPFHFRQAPGEVNALGRVKFMFPNEHAVYLHDTPTRQLFNRSVRMFSSGCVRVENPIAFSDALLAFEADIDGGRVERLIAGGRNGALNLKRRVPVHLTYFTVWVDEAGEVQLRDDIYGHDEQLKSALGLARTGISM